MKASEKRKSTIKCLLCGGGLILATLLVAVGFASWKANHQEYISISASADKINEIEIFTKPSLTTFTLCKDGIVSGETIVTSGQIVATFKIYNNKIPSEYLSGENTNIFAIKVRLTPNKVDFLQYLSGIATNQDSSNTTITKDTSDSSSFTYDISFPIDRDSSESASEKTTSVKITYSVTDESAGNIGTFYSLQDLLKLDFRIKAIRL